MKLFSYLKSAFTSYIISGVVLSVLVFSLIVVHKYKNYLINVLEARKDTVKTRESLRNQIKEMENKIRYLRDDLKLDLKDVYSEKPFFQALDEIKTKMKGASITVARFEKTGSEEVLPVEILVPVKDYNTIVQYTGYINSLMVPRFKVDRLSISRDAAGPVVTLNIRGSLRSPILKR